MVTECSIKESRESINIRHLNSEEQAEPWLVILWLFDKSSMKHLREDVWQYFKAAGSEHAWFQLDQPYDAISNKEWLERLMEASRLLLQRHEQKYGPVRQVTFPADSVARLDDKRSRIREYRQIQEEYGGLIRLLRQRELDNPYLVLKDFFSALSLDEWRELLTLWTEYALCYSSMIQNTEDMNLVLRYEHLQKLLENAYHISLLMDDVEFELIPAHQGVDPQHETAASGNKTTDHEPSHA